MHEVDATPTTNAQRVLTSLREKILSGEMAGGTRLNEIALSTEFGMSRTPVRSALAILAAEDLTVYTPNSGYVVRTYSRRDIQDIIEVRSVLEGLACKQASVEGLSPEHFSAGQRFIEQIDALLQVPDWSEAACDEWLALNEAFHNAILLGSGNRRLASLVPHMRSPLLHRLRHQWFSRSFVERANWEHRELLAIIQSGDQVRSEHLGREHIMRAAAPLIAAFEAFLRDE